jgi:GNAT superfamily N-acetyltransferase
MPGRPGRVLRRIAPDDTAGLADYIRIRSTVTPENPESAEQVRWEDTSYPGEATRFLVELDDRPVATATTGRIWMNRADYSRYWLGLWVLPDARRQGIGGELYRAASEVARAAGKTGLQTEVSEAHADGVRFLVHRGFTVTGRAKMVRLDLRALDPGPIDPPAGVRLTTLAEHPDLVAGVHAVAVEAFPDIPASDEPLEAGSLEEFVKRDVERTGVPGDGFMVALDDATGEVVGYASLMFVPGSTTIAYHDMTAVRPADRGRGVAAALKRATIAWAAEHGLEWLETGNDEENGPMRAINRSLGYAPMPDALEMQGPLAPGT